MGLATGETVSYETRDGKVYIYRALGGKKIDLSTEGEADLVKAKTNATTNVDNHKTAIGSNKTIYDSRVAALAGEATRTHEIVDNFGDTVTINEYDIEEDGLIKTFFVPLSDVSTVSSSWDEDKNNVLLDQTHDDDLITAIAAL